MSIRQLPDLLINQIAAGEVVDRPSSVVKELVENSLDAGAGRVRVQLEQGGKRVIRVVDDGIGMERDELAVALQRHATSKIASLDDLERVATMGFRGEALPSIASVSRLDLASRQSASSHGWAVNVRRGEISEPQPDPIGAGTSVTVEDLFYNVPARRKFLRADRTEYSHVDLLLRRFALARFDVGFDLEHNGKPVSSLPPAPQETEQKLRLQRVMGKDFLEHVVRIDEERAGLSLQGWVAEPRYNRAQRDRQFFFVNGRSVRDRVIAHAVRTAFQDVLYHGRHPAFVLYLYIPPETLDVNVHPQKHEVRFRDSRMVHDFLFSSLRRAWPKPVQALHARDPVLNRVLPKCRAPRIREALAGPEAAFSKQVCRCRCEIRSVPMPQPLVLMWLGAQSRSKAADKARMMPEWMATWKEIFLCSATRWPNCMVSMYCRRTQPAWY
jgi:DNA mismatch repair protein MutL